MKSYYQNFESNNAINGSGTDSHLPIIVSVYGEIIVITYYNIFLDRVYDKFDFKLKVLIFRSSLRI